MKFTAMAMATLIFGGQVVLGEVRSALASVKVSGGSAADREYVGDPAQRHDYSAGGLIG